MAARQASRGDRKVMSRNQAIAIGLSEAHAKSAKVPRTRTSHTSRRKLASRS